jgi:hypothetical protein
VSGRRLLAGLGLLSCACVPYAFVLPPIDSSIDVGPRGTPAVSTVLNVNVGVRPLGLLPDWHHRNNDFSLGYTFTVVPAPLVHGPYGELTHVFVELNTSPTHLWRLRAGVLARLLYAAQLQRFGTQAVARVVFESSTIVDEDFAESNDRGLVMGHAIGELGAGLYAEGGVYALQPQLGWTLSVGLIFTVPASAGVGLAWML